MRPGMVLLSPGVPGTDWTSLTLERPIWSFPGVRRPFPTREDFLCYVDAFARDQRVEVTERTEVVGARRTPEGFAVAVSGGVEIPCRFLVIATGSASVPRYPEIPGIAGNPRVLHSGDFLNCMGYDRKRVLVIGGGNSAAELCIELAGTARTTMCTRGPLRYFSESGELDHIRGTSESVLKELFRFGILSLREADPVVSLSDGTAAFASGARESFDCDRVRHGVSPPLDPRRGRHGRRRGEGVPPHLPGRGVERPGPLLLRIARDVPPPLRLHPRFPQLRRKSVLGHRRPAVRSPESGQAVLEGFRDVGEPCPALGGEVGDRPRHAARLPDRPSRQGEPFRRPREERGRLRRELPQRPAEERAGPGQLPGRPVDARRVEGLRRREVGEDSGDHLILIFPVYLKLMTGFPSYQPEDAGAELLH